MADHDLERYLSELPVIGATDLRECTCGHCAEEHDSHTGPCRGYYDRFDPGSGHYQDDCACEAFTLRAP